MSARGSDAFLDEPEWALCHNFAGGVDFSSINMTSTETAGQIPTWNLTLGTNGIDEDHCDVSVIVHGTTPLSWGIVHTSATAKVISFLNAGGTAVAPGTKATVVIRRVPASMI